jgi:hypothetical protein
VGRGIDGKSVMEIDILPPLIGVPFWWGHSAVLGKNHTLIRQRQYSPGNGTIATTRGIFGTIRIATIDRVN